MTRSLLLIVIASFFVLPGYAASSFGVQDAGKKKDKKTTEKKRSDQDAKKGEPEKGVPEKKDPHAGVPGLPKLPQLTGDRKKDKAAVLGALKKLQLASKKNDDALKVLRKKKRTGKTKELEALERNDAAYRSYAGKIQALMARIKNAPKEPVRKPKKKNDPSPAKKR